MTGFGKAVCELQDKVVNIEIKALNSKQLDLYVRMPNPYRDKEMEIRNELGVRLKRGKVDVGITLEFREGKQTTQINTAIVKGYYQQLRAISEELGIEGSEPLLQTILRLPDALNNEKDAVPEDEWAQIQQSFLVAVDNLEKFRSQEGKTLAFDMMNRINLIEVFLTQIEPFEKERTEQIRNRLSMSQLESAQRENMDANRFEQELIYYLEKLDISEEKTRLKHHCHYFLEVMKEPDQVGRKLGFVAQEIGREINTIGSKANHSGIQKLVVLMKDELEKIKEQLMNVL
jgi:uncharacterized protein (TIGR00255 family)